MTLKAGRSKPQTTAVAVGIVHVDPKCTHLDQELLDQLDDALTNQKVRVLTGIWGRNGAQMENLGKTIFICYRSSFGAALGEQHQ